MTARQKARRSSPLNLPTAFELFGASRKIVKKNIWIFGPLYFLPLIFSFHAWAWTPAIGSNNGHWWTTYSWFGSGFSTASVPAYMWYTFIGFSILWFIFVIAAGTVVQIMSQEAQLEAAQHNPLDFVRLWGTVKELGWRMLGLYVLMALYIGVGFILLIIPGLIMLRRYFLAPYVLLDTKCGITEAMERSAAMTKPYAHAIWGVIGVMFLIGLVNVLPLLGWLISFVLGMFYSVAPALRYQQLKKLV